MEQPDAQHVGPEMDASNSPINHQRMSRLLTKILELPEDFLHGWDQLAVVIDLPEQDGQQTIRPCVETYRLPAPLDAENNEVAYRKASNFAFPCDRLGISQLAPALL